MNVDFSFLASHHCWLASLSVNVALIFIFELSKFNIFIFLLMVGAEDLSIGGLSYPNMPGESPCEGEIPVVLHSPLA